MEREGSWDTLSQKALRMASQSYAKARQVVVVVLSWEMTPPTFSSRGSVRGRKLPESTGLPAGPGAVSSEQWRAQWVGSLRELPPSLQEEKGQTYGFPPRPFSCVMTPDCLQ